MRPNITIIAKARPLEAGCPDNWIVLGLLIALSLLSLGKPFLDVLILIGEEDSTCIGYY